MGLNDIRYHEVQGNQDINKLGFLVNMIFTKYRYLGAFPGSPLVKTLPSNAEGEGSIPGQGAKISQALQPKKQNTKWKQYSNKFNKDFKNSPHQKMFLKKDFQEEYVSIPFQSPGMHNSSQSSTW